MTENIDGLSRVLGRIESKIDGLSSTLDDHKTDLKDLRDDLEAHKTESNEKITQMRTRITYWHGALAAAMAGLVFFKSVIVNAIIGGGS